MVMWLPRESQLEHAKEAIGIETSARDQAHKHANILGRIQAFFGLAG